MHIPCILLLVLLILRIMLCKCQIVRCLNISGEVTVLLGLLIW